MFFKLFSFGPGLASYLKPYVIFISPLSKTIRNSTTIDKTTYLTQSQRNVRKSGGQLVIIGILIEQIFLHIRPQSVPVGRGQMSPCPNHGSAVPVTE